MSHDHSTIQDLETVINAGIDATQIVTDKRQSRNTTTETLADAIDQLEDWATQAADYLPDQPEKDTK